MNFHCEIAPHFEQHKIGLSDPVDNSVEAMGGKTKPRRNDFPLRLAD